MRVSKLALSCRPCAVYHQCAAYHHHSCHPFIPSFYLHPAYRTIAPHENITGDNLIIKQTFNSVCFYDMLLISNDKLYFPWTLCTSHFPRSLSYWTFKNECIAKFLPFCHHVISVNTCLYCEGLLYFMRCLLNNHQKRHQGSILRNEVHQRL